jgi:hypothetical protein
MSEPHFSETDHVQRAGAILKSVLLQACRAGRPGTRRPYIVTDRSEKLRLVNPIEKYWIGLLHEAFEIKYAAPEYMVFSTAKRNKEFGLSQYLFDIAVLERRPKNAKSANLGVEIPVVTGAVWQVESEMAGNGRSVSVDLGKLVCGSAENKLLIVRRPKVGESAPIADINSFVIDSASACKGNLFVVFLPVYAKGHTDLDAHWMKPDLALPHELYVREPTDAGWKMTKWEEFEQRPR